MEEQNKILSTNKGRRKKDDAVADDILAFEAELKVCAKRYGLMVNMFPPLAALLKTTLPDPAPSFNTAARYATTGSQEIAVLAELYDTLPQHLHYLVPMNRFSNMVIHLSCNVLLSTIDTIYSSPRQSVLAVPPSLTSSGVSLVRFSSFLSVTSPSHLLATQNLRFADYLAPLAIPANYIRLCHLCCFQGILLTPVAKPCLATGNSLLRCAVIHFIHI